MLYENSVNFNSGCNTASKTVLNGKKKKVAS